MTGAVEVLEWAEHAHAEVGVEGVKRWIELVGRRDAGGVGGGEGAMQCRWWRGAVLWPFAQLVGGQRAAAGCPPRWQRRRQRPGSACLL